MVRLGERLCGLFLQELPGREGSGQGLAGVQESGEGAKAQGGHRLRHIRTLRQGGVCART